MPFLSAIFGNLLLQKTTVMMMTGLHGKKGLNSLKMPVFRSLSPGQHKLYPDVPKTEAIKKALELSISKAFMAEDMGLEPTGLLHLT